VQDLPAKYRNDEGGSDRLPPEGAPQAAPHAAPASQAELPHTLMVTSLPRQGLDLKEHLNQLEYSLIQQALEESGWVVAHAAKRLHMGRTTLVEKMRKFGLHREGDASGD
jgi:transcriptional regulator with GAF, ATPase, and Fis domain